MFPIILSAISVALCVTALWNFRRRTRALWLLLAANLLNLPAALINADWIPVVLSGACAVICALVLCINARMRRRAEG